MRSESTHLWLSREKALLAGLALSGWGLEESVVDVVAQLDAGHIQLGAGGDHVRLVDAAQRYTVDLVRACGASSPCQQR